MSISKAISPFNTDVPEIKDTVFLQQIGACISKMSQEKNFGVSQLADMLHLSPQQLNRKTQNVAGIPPGKLIADYRICYARQLLLDGEDTIKLIASKCGFYNQTSFNRYFYKHFQCSPSQFRKRYILSDDKREFELVQTPSHNLSSLKELIETKPWLLKIAKIVLANIDNEKLTVVHLAERLCVSTSSLNRNLKKMLAITPREFIKKLRLLYACELLAKKIISISEVAYRAGFFDLAHLSHSFKAVFGYPPSAFHNKCENEFSLSWVADRDSN